MTPAERNIRAIERMIQVRRTSLGPWADRLGFQANDADRLYEEAFAQPRRRHRSLGDQDHDAREIVRLILDAAVENAQTNLRYRDHDSPTALLSSVSLAGLNHARSLYDDNDDLGSLADQAAYVDDETRWQIYSRDLVELTAVHGALTPSGRAEFRRRLPAALADEFGRLPRPTASHENERGLRVQLTLARSLSETATEIERGARLFEFLPALEAELSPDELLTLEHREQYSLEALAALSGVTRAAISKREKKVVSKHDAIWHRLFGPIPSPLGRRQRHDG
jgi:hypothetical protein